ncbi:hypothetical protein ABTN73_19280, partial [Acinetobacter baumannii]
MRNNGLISKIVSSDFEEEVLFLIEKYFNNKDVIFFLAEIVWHGKFSKCIPLLKPIALDQSRDMYSRRISIRAIMSCANTIEKIELWTELNKNEEI